VSVAPVQVTRAYDANLVWRDFPLLVCEDVPEHYAYWQAEVNPKPRDCCNLGAP